MAELDGCRSRWGGDVGELLNKSGDGVAVALEGFAFVVSEVELFEHLVDAVSNSEQLRVCVRYMALSLGYTYTAAD